MMLRTNLGAVFTYYADQPPDQATLDQIAAGGGTVQYVDRAASEGMAYTSTGQAVPAPGSVWALDPYLAGGGNPLYADPANIPTPPPAQLAQCGPRDFACIEENQRRAADNETLRMAYLEALNGAYDPTAPDRYVALLTQYKATGTLPAAVRASSDPLTVYQPPATTPVATPTVQTTPQPTAPRTQAPAAPATPTAAPSTTPAPTQPSGYSPMPALRPAVGAGTTAPQVLELKAAASGIPVWALVAAGAAALFLLGGRR